MKTRDFRLALGAPCAAVAAILLCVGVYALYGRDFDHAMGAGLLSAMFGARGLL